MELTDRQMVRFSRSYFVNPQTNCWEWTGHLYSNGYGRFNTGKKCHLAHRLSWQLHGRKILTSKVICHRCDVRHCVNPDHLFQATQAENLADMRSKGRGSFGERNGMAKLPTRYIRLIRLLHKFGDFQIKEIASLFGVKYFCIQAIVTNKRWKHL